MFFPDCDLNGVPNGPREYHHDLHCNTNRTQPMGCQGCSCYMYQRAKDAERALDDKFRVTYLPNPGGSPGPIYVRFRTKDSAVTFAKMTANAHPGVMVYLEDYEAETVDEYLCEIQHLGTFPMHNHIS